MEARGYNKLDVVVCNLYPFQKRVADPAITIDDAVEEVDIGTGGARRRWRAWPSTLTNGRWHACAPASGH